MSVMLTDQLRTRLKQLRLSGVLETLDLRLRQAQDETWAHLDFLERLLEDEVERRHHKQFALRLRRAAFQADKTIERFDFSFNPQLNRQAVMNLATCQFIQRKEAVLIVGQTGTGKSHLSQALGHEACRKGFDVLYLNAGYTMDAWSFNGYYSNVLTGNGNLEVYDGNDAYGVGVQYDLGGGASVNMGIQKNYGRSADRRYDIVEVEDSMVADFGIKMDF